MCCGVVIFKKSSAIFALISQQLYARPIIGSYLFAPLSFTSVNIFVKKGLGMRVCDDAFIVERSWTFETDPL